MALRCSTHCQGISQFYLHTLRFIRKRNELYLHLPCQTQLVLIYRPRREGRLSGPWCEVAPVGIPNCNLPTTSPALYNTAISAPVSPVVRSHRSDPGVRPTFYGGSCIIYIQRRGSCVED